MLFNSLRLGDVLELVLISGLVFTVLGIYLAKNSDRLKFFIKSAAFLKNNLKDSGSFSDFLKK